MRVVFDTNIFISALVFPGGTGEKALFKVIEGKDTLLLSKEILDETLSILSNKFSQDKEEISRVAILLWEMSERIPRSNRIHFFKDDPDNRILECALDGKADLIVTGDRKVLNLREYRGVKIVSLKTYLETCSNK